MLGAPREVRSRRAAKSFRTCWSSCSERPSSRRPFELELRSFTGNLRPVHAAIRAAQPFAPSCQPRLDRRLRHVLELRNLGDEEPVHFEQHDRFPLYRWKQGERFRRPIGSRRLVLFRRAPHRHCVLGGRLFQREEALPERAPAARTVQGQEDREEPGSESRFVSKRGQLPEGLNEGLLIQVVPFSAGPRKPPSRRDRRLVDRFEQSHQTLPSGVRFVDSIAILRSTVQWSSFVCVSNFLSPVRRRGSHRFGRRKVSQTYWLYVSAGTRRKLAVSRVARPPGGRRPVTGVPARMRRGHGAQPTSKAPIRSHSGFGSENGAHGDAGCRR